MDAIRIGFVGLGGICRQRHVPGLKRIPGIEILGVANRTRESGERAAAEFGIPRVFDRWQDLVACPDIDAVFIGTWPYMHRPISLAALDAGKHVFCQARMAMDFGEARDMLDAARSSGRVAALCPVPFGLSIDAVIARLIRTRELGAIRLVRVQSFTDAFARPESPLSWRKDHRLSGLNMHTLGMYIEVIHRWFGFTRAVYPAQIHTFTPERPDATGALVRVRIPDQVLFSAEMAGEYPVEYTISAAVYGGVDSIEIYGSDMTLRYEIGPDRLLGAKPGEAYQPVPIYSEEAYNVQDWRVEADFVDAIRNGTPYHPSFLHGARYMQVVQAVYDASSAGRILHLEALM